MRKTKYALEEHPELKRRCWICKKEYSLILENFSKDKSRKYGLKNQCRRCAVKKTGSYRYELNSDASIKIRCHMCKKLYPATLRYFQRDRTRKYGIKHKCKWCVSKEHRENSEYYYINRQRWKLKNKDREKAYSKLYELSYSIRRKEVGRIQRMARRNAWPV